MLLTTLTVNANDETKVTIGETNLEADKNGSTVVFAKDGDSYKSLDWNAMRTDIKKVVGGAYVNSGAGLVEYLWVDMTDASIATHDSTLNTAAVNADIATLQAAVDSITATGATFTLTAALQAAATGDNGTSISAPVINDSADRWSYSDGVFTVTNEANTNEATAIWTVSKGGVSKTLTLTLTGGSGTATYTAGTAVS